MRAVGLGIVLTLLSACGHAETPQEAAYREYAKAEERFSMASKANDRQRMCSESNVKAELMMRAGNQAAYERDAAYARLICPG